MGITYIESPASLGLVAEFQLRRHALVIEKMQYLASYTMDITCPAEVNVSLRSM
jgi:hypothetical protein